MSKEIDTRVVEMKFDNEQFKQKAGETLNVLQKLKEKITEKVSGSALNGLTDAANQVDLSRLADNIDRISKRFTVMGEIGANVIGNITNSVMGMGKNLINAVAVEPLRSGFEEYQTQMGAIQTILANTGLEGQKGIDKVNNALGELNTYADQTIYNFTEMTKNIGTFTAAGVDLNTSVASIKGIANLAALSGSTSQQASTAMYQLSQAIAAGTVKLQDWNSVVNAGMGGKVFQNALMHTAAALDGAGESYEAWKEAQVDAYGGFRESLTKGGWLTTEVLTETLNNFTLYTDKTTKAGRKLYKEYMKNLTLKGYTEEQAKEILKTANSATEAATKVRTFTQLIDTAKEMLGSGWTQTWQYIFGDFQEATDLFTGLSEKLSLVVTASDNARLAIAKDFHDDPLFGRKYLLKSIGNFAGDIADLLAPIGEAYNDVIGKFDYYTLRSIIKSFGQLSKELKINNGTMFLIKSTAAALFEVLKIGLVTIGKTIEIPLKLAGPLFNLLESLINFVGRIVEGIFKVSGLSKVFKAISTAIKQFGNGYDKFIDWIALKIDKLAELIDKIHLDKTIVKYGNLLKKFLGNTLKGFDKLTGKTGSKFLKGFSDRLIDIYKGSKKASSGIKGLTSSLKTDAGNGIVALAEKLTDIFTKSGSGMKNVTGSFVKARNSGKGLVDSLKESIGVFGEYVRTSKGLKNSFDFLEKNTSGGLKTFVKDLRSATNGTKSFSNVFYNLAKNIKKTFSNFITNFKSLKVWKEIGSDIQRGATRIIPTLSTIGKILGAVIVYAVQSLAKLLSKINWTSVGNFLLNVYDGLRKVGGYIVDVLSGALEKIKGFFIDDNGELKKFPKIIESVTDALKDLADVFKGLFGHDEGGAKSGKASKAIKEEASGFDKLVESLENFVNAVDPAEIASAILTGVMITFAIKTLNALTSIGKAIDSAGSMMTNIGGMFKSLETTISSFKKVQKSKYKDFSESIAILAASVFLLSRIPKKQLLNAVGAITVLAILMAGITVLQDILAKKLKTKDIDVKDIVKQNLSLLAVAGSFLLLAASLKVISTIKLNKNSIVVLFATLGIFVTEMFALVAFTKFAGPNTKGLLGIIAMSAALYVVVKSLEGLANVKVNKVKNAMLPIIGIMATFAAITKFVGGFGGVGGAIAIILLAENFNKFLKIFKTIETYDFKKLQTSLSGAKNLIIGLIAFMAGFAILSKFTGKGQALAGLGILEITSSLLVIYKAVEMFGKLDQSVLKQGMKTVKSLITMFGLITVLMIFTKDAKPAQAGLAYMEVGIALMILVADVFILGTLPKNVVKQGVTAASILMTFLGICVKLATVAENSGSKFSTLIAVGLSIGILVGEMIALSMINVGGLIPALAAMIIVMGMYRVVLGGVAKIKDPETTTKTIVALGVSLGALAAAMVILSQLPTNQVLASAIGLSVAMVALGAFIKEMNKLPAVNLKMLGSLGLALASIAAIAGILAFVSKYDWGSMLGASIAIGVVLLAISGTIKILNGIDAATAFKAATGILAFLAPFALVFAGLIGLGGLIATFASGFGDFILAGVGFIGKIIGALVNGFNSMQNTKPVAKKANTLKKSITNLVDAVKAVRGVNEGDIKAAKNLASAVAAITGARISNGIGNFLSAITGGTGGFTQACTELGGALTAFQTATVGVDTKSVVKAARAAKLITEAVATIPNSGGMLGKLLGNNDADDFGVMLEHFGVSLVTFANKTKELDDDGVAGVNRAAKISKAMVTVADSIPNSGGLLAGILGDNDFSTFGAGLESYAEALNTFATKAKELSGKDVKAIAKVVKISKGLVELENGIENGGESVFSFFTGRSDFASFGEGLKSYGQALVDFGTSVSGIKPETAQKIEWATKASMGLADLLAAIPEDWGMTATWSVSSNFEDVGKGLVKFINSLSGIKETDPDKIDVATKVAESIGKLGAAMKKGVPKRLTNMGPALASIGSGLKTFASEIAGVDFSNVDQALDAAEKASKITPPKSTGKGKSTGKKSSGSSSKKKSGNTPKQEGANASTEYATSYIGNLMNYVPNVQQSAGAVGQATTEGIQTYTSQMGIPGKDGIVNLINGMVDGSGQVIPAGMGQIQQCITDNSGNVLNGFGTNVTTSIQNIKNKANTEAQKLGTVGDTGAKAVNNRLKNASGSGGKEMVNAQKRAANKAVKGFGSIGEKIVNQFKKGITSNLDGVRSSGRTMVNAVKNSANKAVKGFGSIGKSVVNQFCSGIRSNIGRARSYGRSIVNAAKSGAGSAVSNMQSVGRSVVNNFSSGVINNLKGARKAGRSLVNAAKSAAKTAGENLVDTGYDIGANFSQGLIDGMNSKKKAVKKTAASLANAASKASKEAFKEKSPSKVAFKIGDYYTIGLINGINNSRDQLYNTSASLAMSINDRFNAFAQPSYSPLIDPVVNTSGMANQLAMLNSGYLSTEAYRLYSSPVDLSFSKDLDQQIISKQNPYDDSNVVGAISGLRSDFNDLSSKMKDIQVVLDTGATVGQLSGPMDQALGKQKAYRMRGSR